MSCRDRSPSRSPSHSPDRDDSDRTSSGSRGRDSSPRPEYTGGYGSADAAAAPKSWAKWGTDDFHRAWIADSLVAFTLLLVKVYGDAIVEFLKNESVKWPQFQREIDEINDMDWDEDETHPLDQCSDPEQLYYHLCIGEEVMRRVREKPQEMPTTAERYRELYLQVARTFAVPPYVAGETAYVLDIKPCEICQEVPSEYDTAISGEHAPGSTEDAPIFGFLCGGCRARHGMHQEVGMGKGQRLVWRPAYVLDPREPRS